MPNWIASDVEATKEPLMSNAAFSPKKIPLGLIKNKLKFGANPSACIVPNIFDGKTPVTRPITF